jgi:alpha-mannosidase
VPGLSVEGGGVVLSSLRRREDHLELRIVNESPSATTATIGIPLAAAREADLLGRPGADLPLAADDLVLTLGPWEIRTIQLRIR